MYYIRQFTTVVLISIIFTSCRTTNYFTKITSQNDSRGNISDSLNLLERLQYEKGYRISRSDYVSVTLINRKAQTILHLQSDSTLLLNDSIVQMAGFLKNFNKEVLAKTELTLPTGLAKEAVFEKEFDHYRFWVPGLDSIQYSIYDVSYNKIIPSLYYSVKGVVSDGKGNVVEFVADSDPIGLIFIFVGILMVEKWTHNDVSAINCLSECEKALKVLGQFKTIDRKCVAFLRKKGKVNTIECAMIPK